MTPNPMGPNSATSAFTGGSPNLYNNISSAGVPPENQEQTEDAQPVGADAQSEKLTKRFTMTFQLFKDLSSEFPGGESEVNAVLNAMGNWLQKAQASVNDSASPTGY